MFPGVIEMRRTTSASCDDVWAVLCDGWAYASWVVGASRIRGVDTGWPATGTRIHHSVGVWPLLINDTTLAVRSEPGRELVLQARAWPVGEATVQLRLEPTEDGGCVLSMIEDASRGPGRFIPHPARQAMIAPRNRESLRRLAYMAEGRSLSR